MTHRQILIVTPHADFGDIVSQSLSKEAGSDVKVATSMSEALTHIRKSADINYALLDMEMGVERAMEEGFLFRKTFPEISLILISKKYPPVEMEDLRPWKFLRKPFVEKELLDLIHEDDDIVDQSVSYVDSSACKGVEETISAWYEDEVRATKNLVAAISNLNVQEAILVSNTNVLAHSGELSVEAVDECSRLVRKYLGENTTAELIKPIRLNATRKEHLLAATVIAVGIILALAFDAETPFSTMRSQTRYLTNVLKNPQLSLSDTHLLPQTQKTEETKVIAPAVRLESADSKALPDTCLPEITSNQAEKPQQEMTVQPASVPVEPVVEPIAEVNCSKDETTQTSFTAQEHLTEPSSPAAWTPPMQAEEKFRCNQTTFWIQGNQYSEAAFHSTVEVSNGSLYPTNSSLFDVYYSCLLVPRIRTHYLEGDCASYLREELPNIFLAFSWRLEKLVVERTYIEWLVRIPPTVAPAAHIKAVRKHSSRMILSNFPSFNRNELLKDFWAPGYLLGCGQRLIPPAEITEFIRSSRRQYYPDENPLWETNGNFLNYQ
jgi:REP element-mobilizing transposase RayT/CheY-like chemotaxis protein